MQRKRTLDLQYYIFRGDATGRLLTDALLRAADRQVRVSVLIDDGETVSRLQTLERTVEIWNVGSIEGPSRIII